MLDGKVSIATEALRPTRRRTRYPSPARCAPADRRLGSRCREDSTRRGRWPRWRPAEVGWPCHSWNCAATRRASTATSTTSSAGSPVDGRTLRPTRPTPTARRVGQTIAPGSCARACTRDPRPAVMRPELPLRLGTPDGYRASAHRAASRSARPPPTCRPPTLGRERARGRLPRCPLRSIRLAQTRPAHAHLRQLAEGRPHASLHETPRIQRFRRFRIPPSPAELARLLGLFSTWSKPWPNCRAPLSFSTRAAAAPSEGVEEQAEGFTDTQPRGRTAGLFSRGCFDYLERVAAPSVVVQKYKRLRAVEVALCGTL